MQRLAERTASWILNGHTQKMRKQQSCRCQQGHIIKRFQKQCCEGGAHSRRYKVIDPITGRHGALQLFYLLLLCALQFLITCFKDAQMLRWVARQLVLTVRKGADVSRGNSDGDSRKLSPACWTC